MVDSKCFPVVLFQLIIFKSFNNLLLYSLGYVLLYSMGQMCANFFVFQIKFCWERKHFLQYVFFLFMKQVQISSVFVSVFFINCCIVKCDLCSIIFLYSYPNVLYLPFSILVVFRFSFDTESVVLIFVLFYVLNCFVSSVLTFLFDFVSWYFI